MTAEIKSYKENPKIDKNFDELNGEVMTDVIKNVDQVHVGERSILFFTEESPLPKSFCRRKIFNILLIND